ncbi:MAG: hypothetical protein R3224_04435, partial [Balneolaceae bacterium]|nr:hypothetical protein [Balneolaceae bacterium]
PQRTGLIAPYLDDLPVRRLLWFSNGYYTVENKTDGLYFTDLRFGRSDIWLSDRDAPYTWNYRLEFNSDSSAVTGFLHFDPSFEVSSDRLASLIGRTFGREKSGGQ